MDSRTFNRLTTPKDKVLTSMEGEMSSLLNDGSMPSPVESRRSESESSPIPHVSSPSPDVKDSSPSPARSGLESDSSPSPRTRVPISASVDTFSLSRTVFEKFVF